MASIPLATRQPQPRSVCRRNTRTPSARQCAVSPSYGVNFDKKREKNSLVDRWLHKLPKTLLVVFSRRGSARNEAGKNNRGGAHRSPRHCVRTYAAEAVAVTYPLG